MISGEDRHDFLQRQTTHDINQLSPNKPLVTVLTSPSARILDVLTLIEEGEILRVITLPGKVIETLIFLRNRIFFNDRVSVDDESDSMVLVNILGPDSSEFLLHLGINETLTRANTSARQRWLVLLAEFISTENWACK